MVFSGLYLKDIFRVVLIKANVFQ